MTRTPGESLAGNPMAATARRRSGLYQTAVLRALRGMDNGRLTITLPDGEDIVLGQRKNPRGSKHGFEARIEVTNRDFFRRCFYYGDIGLAESYMAGDWKTEDLTEVISWFILNAGDTSAQSTARRRVLNWLGWFNGIAHKLRANSLDRSRENIAAHYDLSNEFFSLFLDSSMTYSSGIFASTTTTLEEAQEAKYERLCQLLELRPHDRVLEIGTGWGAMSRYIAQRYGCHVTTTTISANQHAWAAQLMRDEGLESKIDLRLLDYRKLEGKFDKIVSIEMLEAVGHEYFDTYFARCADLLAPNGLMAVQVITCPDPRYEATRRDVDFIQKHIFPGGLIPSVGALLASVHRTSDLMLSDLADFGQSYARTLQLWDEAFESRIQHVRALGFDEIFLRKWRYYLRYCRAAFQMRHVSVVQMLLTRPNNHSRSDATGDLLS